MESYFTRTDSVLKRFFFIFGLTKDRFCEDNHIRVDLDRILYKHLKDIGYKRIIFYSLTEQLYFYDIDSFNSTKRPNEVLKEKITEKPVTKPNRLQGPILGKFKSAANTSEQNHTSSQNDLAPEINTGKLHFGKMDSNMAFERIGFCIKDNKIKTVAIFTNADDFIKYFVEGIDRHVFDSFNQFDGLGPDNHNIVLFVFPEGNQSDVIARYRDTFFERKISETNTININPPATEEIRNTINYYRLMHGLSVDFTCLDTVCKRIARELCKNKRSLKWLMAELKKIVDSSQILDAEKCDAMLGEKEETAMQKLNKLIGMEDIKREVKALKTILQNSAEKNSSEVSEHTDYRSRLLPAKQVNKKMYNMHYILTGNPGTGKTTVAKLLGEIYYELGYLESGHTVKVTRDDLVAGYVGQTAPKTKNKIEEAMGGVLFIDEAYSLAKGGENDFGQEAVDTLVEAMTDRNGKFAVVVAGYPKEMGDFLNLNPGLKDRFESKLHIEDYTPAELLDIFNMNMRKEKFWPSENLSNIILDFLKNWYTTRNVKDWSNARGVEKLINRMYKNWGLRGGEKNDSGEPILDTADVPAELQQYCKPSTETREDAMIKLKNLTGLNGVKDRIEKLKRRIQMKGKTEPGHYVFSGNPGTGKTTVARLLGDILREEGVLRRGHVVEVLREDLVAGYVGQTAIKTKEKLQEAMDGIFFLDEAYSLVQGGENDFGKEAINTILAFMENNRSRICVIFAGYTKNMDDFIQSNPGLTRRISETLIFDDYNTDEMIEILKNFARDFVLEPEYIQKSRQIFDNWIKNKTSNFGNAGQVRNYFAECEDALFERIDKEYGSDIPEEVKKTLTGKDISIKYTSITGASQ